MDLNKFKMNNNESVSLSVSPSLSLLVDKIFTESNSSKQSAIFQFHKVIQNNIDNEKNISYILHCLSSQISSTQNSIERRKQLLTFLPSFFLPFAYNIDMAYPYVSRILTIIQNTISLSGITPEYMSSIFSDVVIAIFQNEIENENQVDSNKNNYELFQGFCIYNMKQSDEHLQQFGAMCLKVLTSTLNYYAKNDKYLKYIWEKVIVFIDNENFNDTIDLLHSIENLIVKSGGDKFKGYANITLYKILDYMTVGNEDEVRNLKKRNKNNLVIIVILNIVSFIVLLLSFIFIKLNVAVFETIIFITTILIVCFDIYFIDVIYLYNKMYIKFLTKMVSNKKMQIQVLKFDVSIVKQTRNNIQINKVLIVNDSIEKEVYIESSKVNDFLKITDISYCFLVDNFIVGVE